jgi:hypothetical protein
MPRKATHYTDPDVEGGQYQYNISRTALGKMEKNRQGKECGGVWMIK